jgi:hypothetical protein
VVLQDVFIPPRQQQQQQHRRTPEPIDVVIDSGVHLHRENEMQPMQREQSPEGVTLTLYLPVFPTSRNVI